MANSSVPAVNDSQTVEQEAFFLVAERAHYALKLLEDADDARDLEARAAYIASARALVQQIGWIADGRSGENTPLLGEACDWMLPREYVRASRALESS